MISAGVLDCVRQHRKGFNPLQLHFLPLNLAMEATKHVKIAV